jgi:hypothetical protein
MASGIRQVNFDDVEFALSFSTTKPEVKIKKLFIDKFDKIHRFFRKLENEYRRLGRPLDTSPSLQRASI